MKTKMSLFAVIMALFMVSCGSSKKSQNEMMMMMMMQQMQGQNQAQNQAQASALVSEVDEKVQEWKSQGYQLTGAYSTFTMKSLLVQHNEKAMDKERYQPLQGNGLGIEVSDARLYALNDAAINYATAAGSVISGGLSRQFSNIGDASNKLVGAYTQKVAQFMAPYMKESFCLYRKNGNKIEVVSYYLIDQENAYQVRKNAMNQALRETATEQIIGQSIDEYVKELVKDVPQE